MDEQAETTTRIIYHCPKCGQAVRVDYPTITEDVGGRPVSKFRLGTGVETHWIPSKDCPRCGRMMSRNPIAATFRASVRCAAACRNAVGEKCVCSCAGANHGATWLMIEEA